MGSKLNHCWFKSGNLNSYLQVYIGSKLPKVGMTIPDSPNPRGMKIAGELASLLLHILPTLYLAVL